MMASGQAFAQRASDGCELRGTLWGDPHAKAAVQLLHGLGEHHGRYQALADALVAAGYHVVAHDHRGHGGWLATDELGFFAASDGWQRVVDDAIAVRQRQLGTRHKKVFLLGHSMGSYIAQAAMMAKPDLANGLVLSGSTHAPRLDVRVGRWVAMIERWRQGPHGRSNLLAKMSFGKFNQSFEPARTDFDWLSRDPAEVDKYIADPACGVASTNQLWIDLLGGLLDIGRRGALSGLPTDLPVYIVSGSDDPVSAGNRIAALEKYYVDSGMREVELKVYPEARHELFNETNRVAVRSDLVAVLDRWRDHDEDQSHV